MGTIVLMAMYAIPRHSTKGTKNNHFRRRNTRMRAPGSKPPPWFCSSSLKPDMVPDPFSFLRSVSLEFVSGYPKPIRSARVPDMSSRGYEARGDVAAERRRNPLIPARGGYGPA